jgi:predicted acetyltransferase
MSVEIRACRDREEMAAYGRVVSYVFADNDAENVATEIESTQPEWTTCGFVDGQMAATMGAFPFTVRLDGAPVRMAGVTAVGTLPAYRRQGLLRRIMHQGFREMRERGQAYAILWASMGAIYQRFGYGAASEVVSYRFDPRFAGLQFGPPPSGSISLYTPEDGFPIAKQLFIQWASPRNLHIHRSTVLWQVDNLRPRKKGEPVYIAVYRNADGEARGHIVYQTYNDETVTSGPSQVLDVKDFVYLDLDAYRGLWEYIRRHDLVGSVHISKCIGADDPAPDLLLEPRVLNRRTSDGIWMRVVDIEAAIPQRPYGDRGELTFTLHGDDMCDWNNGTYLLETDGKTTAVRRTDRTPDLTVTPNALATLLAGHRTATHLARAGRLEARDEAALRTADALFRTNYPPNCPNNF